MVLLGILLAIVSFILGCLAGILITIYAYSEIGKTYDFIAEKWVKRE